jgi:hypothetical protein
MRGLRRGWRRIPVAVRFFAVHALVGFGLGTLLTAALLWADPGGAGAIIARAPGHPGPLLLLWFFLSLTLGAVQSAAAVMLLGYPDPPARPPGGLGAATAATVPQRSRAHRGAAG